MDMIRKFIMWKCLGRPQTFKKDSRDGLQYKTVLKGTEIPGANDCGLNLLLLLVLALRGFSPGTPVFPSPKNQHVQIPISIQNLRATG